MPKAVVTPGSHAILSGGSHICLGVNDCMGSHICLGVNDWGVNI